MTKLEFLVQLDEYFTKNPNYELGISLDYSNVDEPMILHNEESCVINLNAKAEGESDIDILISDKEGSLYNKMHDVFSDELYRYLYEISHENKEKYTEVCELFNQKLNTDCSTLAREIEESYDFQLEDAPYEYECNVIIRMQLMTMQLRLK